MGEGKLRMSCPECGVRVRISPETAKVQRACPKCGATVVFVPVEQAALQAADVLAVPRGGLPALCPGCGAQVPPGATECPECGRAVKPKGGVRTGRQGPPAESRALPLVAGLLAAVIGGVVWGAIGAAADVEIGFLAWGIGILTGVAVTMFTSERSAELGTIAAGLALAGLVIGKLLVVQWGLVPAVAKELMQSPEFLLGAISTEMIDNGEVDSEVAEWLDSDDEEEPEGELAAKCDEFWAKVIERLEGMSHDEKYALAKRFTEAAVAEMSYAERLMDMLSPWDALWAGLAVVSAWKIAAGAGGGGATPARRRRPRR